MTLRLVTGVLG